MGLLRKFGLRPRSSSHALTARGKSATRATRLLLVLASALAAASACISELEPDDSERRAGTCKPEDSDPLHYVSFQDNLMPLFTRAGSQGGCTCHMPSNRTTTGIDQSGLSLENFNAVMRGGNSSRDTIVVPGDPCASVLFQKVSAGPPFGARMPPSGPPFFTPQEMKLLSDWIAEGAHDN